MSKPSWQISLIVVGSLIVLIAIAEHFGWIAGAPPLLAPGLH